MNWSALARAFFLALGVFALACLPPAFVAVAAEERNAYLLSACAIGAVAGAGALAAPRRRGDSRFREGMLFAVGLWFVVPVFAAAPMAMTGLSLVDAYFDAVSAVTTTGLWRRPDAVYGDNAAVLYRALLSWLGGFGTLAVIAAVLLKREFGGVNVRTPSVFAAGEKGVFPAAGRLAGAFTVPYLILTFGLAAALGAAGAGGFDALILALGAAASSGAIVDPEALAQQPAAVLAILAVGQALGAVSFFFTALLVTGRSPRIDEETGAFIAVVAVVAAAFWLYEPAAGLTRFAEHLFNANGLFSTNGLILGAPPPITPTLVAACIGGSVLSTAGGLKLARWLSVFRRARRELRRLATPEAVARTPRNRDALGVWVHFTAFVFVLAALVLALASGGAELPDAAIGAVAAFANVGPLAAQAGESFVAAAETPAATIALIIAMALGRLDAVAALAILTRAFWRS
ncbi:MAG: hypothetical protein AAFR11_12055 [Pseudomonadota bacterium]